jgi:hypothetical protein
VLVANAFASAPEITVARVEGCNGNVTFSDENADGDVTPDEVTGEVDCGQ